MNPFLGIGERAYSFADIDDLELIKSRKAPNGKIIRNGYYIVSFNDGRDYNFHKTSHDLSFEQQAEIVSFLADRASKKVRITDPYPS